MKRNCSLAGLVLAILLVASSAHAATVFDGFKSAKATLYDRGVDQLDQITRSVADRTRRDLVQAGDADVDVASFVETDEATGMLRIGLVMPGAYPAPETPSIYSSPADTVAEADTALPKAMSCSDFFTQYRQRLNARTKLVVGSSPTKDESFSKYLATIFNHAHTAATDAELLEAGRPLAANTMLEIRFAKTPEQVCARPLLNPE